MLTVQLVINNTEIIFINVDVLGNVTSSWNISREVL